MFGLPGKAKGKPLMKGNDVSVTEAAANEGAAAALPAPPHSPAPSQKHDQSLGVLVPQQQMWQLLLPERPSPPPQPGHQGTSQGWGAIGDSRGLWGQAAGPKPQRQSTLSANDMKHGRPAPAAVRAAMADPSARQTHQSPVIHPPPSSPDDDVSMDVEPKERRQPLAVGGAMEEAMGETMRGGAVASPPTRPPAFPTHQSPVTHAPHSSPGGAVSMEVEPRKKKISPAVGAMPGRLLQAALLQTHQTPSLFTGAASSSFKGDVPPPPPKASDDDVVFVMEVAPKKRRPAGKRATEATPESVMTGSSMRQPLLQTHRGGTARQAPSTPFDDDDVVYMMEVEAKEGQQPAARATGSVRRGQVTADSSRQPHPASRTPPRPHPSASASVKVERRQPAEKRPPQPLRAFRGPLTVQAVGEAMREVMAGRSSLLNFKSILSPETVTTNLAAVQTALQALLLHMDRELRKVTQPLGLCDALSRLLTDGPELDRETWILAVKSVTRLSTCGVKDNANRLKAADVGEHLVMYLRMRLADVEVQDVGLRALSVLLEHASGYVDRLAQEGVLELAVAALQAFPSHQHLCRYGCSVVKDLVRPKQTQASPEAVEAALAVLRTFPNDQDLQREACRALASLTLCKNGAEVAAAVEKAGVCRAALTSLKAETRRLDFWRLMALMGSPLLAQVLLKLEVLAVMVNTVKTKGEAGGDSRVVNDGLECICHWKEWAAGLAEAGAAAIVANALRSESADEKTLEFATLAFGALAHNPLGARRLVESGACQLLVEALHKYPANVTLQTRGCGAMRRLCNEWPSGGPMSFAASSTVGAAVATDVVLDALRLHAACKELQIEGLDAVKALGSEDRNRTALAEAGAGTLALWALRRFQWDDGVEGVGFGALAAMVREGDETRAALIAGGACPVTLTALQRDTSPLGVQRAVLDATCSLTLDPKAVRLLLESHAEDLLDQTLQRFPNDPVIQSAGWTSLTRLTKEHAEVRQKVLRSGAVARLVEGMETFSTQPGVQSSAMAALAALTQRQADLQEELGQLGAVTLVLEVMTRFPEHRNVQTQGLLLVSHLATDADNTQALAESGVCEVLGHALRTFSDDAGVWEAAWAALVGLSFHGVEATRKQLEAITQQLLLSEAMEVV